MRDCGRCRNFVKFKNDMISGGLCEFKDCRTSTDSGKNCQDFRPARYSREQLHGLAELIRRA
jgi:hypothetical protein